MTAPDRHAVANALLAAQCPAGVCARDVDQLDRALRGRLFLQADNLIRSPFGLLDALGLRVADDAQPCEVDDWPGECGHEVSPNGVERIGCWGNEHGDKPHAALVCGACLACIGFDEHTPDCAKREDTGTQNGWMLWTDDGTVWMSTEHKKPEWIVWGAA